MAHAGGRPAPSAASLRWRILRRSLLSDSGPTDEEAARVSRVPSGSFGFIESRCLEEESEDGDALWQYTLPDKSTLLRLRQARNRKLTLEDHSTCRKLGIDNTGVICLWPAEEILAFYCLSRPHLFRNKRVIELGAGYGLAGMALAACTEVAEILITDGNPKVVEYIKKNISMNQEVFGKTAVRSSVLQWSKEPLALGAAFDIILAADCTYFKDYHLELVLTIKYILNSAESSEALLFCPTRGTSLSDFVNLARSAGLDVVLKEQYDSHVWQLHNKFVEKGNAAWENYDKDHNYPLLVSITLDPSVKHHTIQ